MHELPIMEDVLDIILKYSERNKVTKVLSITIEIGALSDMEPEWINYYFKKISRRTLAEEAFLKINKIAPKLKCKVCHTSHVYKEPKELTCYQCGNSDWQLVADSHYTIKEMEVL